MTQADWASYASTKMNVYGVCSNVYRTVQNLALDLKLEVHPMYACPVRHWTNRRKTSRWSFSATKCLVGLRDEGILLDFANLPLGGPFCQSRTNADWVKAFARQRANALDVLIGVLQENYVASLARTSALSLPFMLQWLGHHAILIEWVGSSSRNFVILR